MTLGVQSIACICKKLGTLSAKYFLKQMRYRALFFVVERSWLGVYYTVENLQIYLSLLFYVAFNMPQESCAFYVNFL